MISLMYALCVVLVVAVVCAVICTYNCIRSTERIEMMCFDLSDALINERDK